MQPYIIDKLPVTAIAVKSTDFSPFCAVLLCVFSRFIQTVLERFSFEDVENPVESVENPLVWPVFHRFRGCFQHIVENLST